MYRTRFYARTYVQNNRWIDLVQPLVCMPAGSCSTKCLDTATFGELYLSPTVIFIYSNLYGRGRLELLHGGRCRSVVPCRLEITSHHSASTSTISSFPCSCHAWAWHACTNRQTPPKPRAVLDRSPMSAPSAATAGDARDPPKPLHTVVVRPARRRSLPPPRSSRLIVAGRASRTSRPVLGRRRRATAVADLFWHSRPALVLQFLHGRCRARLPPGSAAAACPNSEPSSAHQSPSPAGPSLRRPDRGPDEQDQDWRIGTVRHLSERFMTVWKVL